MYILCINICNLCIYVYVLIYVIYVYICIYVWNLCIYMYSCKEFMYIYVFMYVTYICMTHVKKLLHKIIMSANSYGGGGHSLSGHVH